MMTYIETPSDDGEIWLYWLVFKQDGYGGVEFEEYVACKGMMANIVEKYKKQEPSATLVRMDLVKKKVGFY